MSEETRVTAGYQLAGDMAESASTSSGTVKPKLQKRGEMDANLR